MNFLKKPPIQASSDFENRKFRKMLKFGQRQKRGETYWVKDAKPIKPGIPIGRPGNILGLTNAL